MTGLLERRLKELHEIGLIRQQGLDLDQKKDSNRCYADLEAERQRMAAEQLANELRPSRMRFNAGADGKGHASAVQSARNDGPDGDGGNDGHAALVNHLNPFRRMSGLVGLRPEEDAALIKKLHDLKRELQKIEVACAGRLIDSVVFAVDAPPPFPLDVRVVLKYVGYKISVPYDPKYFRYYLLHPLSISIANDLFWFIHCHTFQLNSTFLQEVLVTSVSEKYVSLSNKVEKNRSLFFQSYPYAVASALCSAFHYFVPGSRNLYDSSFRLQVNILVVRLLSGMEVCAVAVQNSLERLFPDERTAAEEAAKKAQPNSKSSTGLLSSTMQSIGEDDGAGDSGEAVSTDEGKEVDSPGEEDVDELTTAALAGKLNVRDRLLLGPVNSHHVEVLRSLPRELLVPAPAPVSSSSATQLRSHIPFDGSVPTVSSDRDRRFADVDNPSSRALSPSQGSTADATLMPVESANTAPTLQADVTTFEPGVLRPSWSKKETEADVGFRSLLLRSKKRQLRTPFCASSVSPLVQRFLETDASIIGRPVMLKRTTPVPWSAVGGVDTFRSTVPRDAYHATIRAELQAARTSYAEELSLSRKEDLRVSAELRNRRNAVLHGSQAARSKFCSSITDQLEGRRRRGHSDDVPILRSYSNVLPAPSTLTSIRADLSVVDNFKLARSDNPAWENFKASGLGWNPTAAAVEFQLIPPSVGGGNTTATSVDSPKSEQALSFA